MKLTVYGARGSIPMSHLGGSRYGGNTPCMILEAQGERLILDAGSGLMLLQEELLQAYPDYPDGIPEQHLLLSHLHLDHIIGLGMFRGTFADHAPMHIYTCSRGDNSLEDQLYDAFKPPFWPTPLKDIAKVSFTEITVQEPFHIGPFTVSAFLSKHPDQTLMFHITDGEKTCVYLLDSEIKLLTPTEYQELVAYCQDADIVIADASYTPADYEIRRGWGHSTMFEGMQLARDSGCKNMIFAHLSPFYSDEELTSWERHFEPGCHYILAYEGLVLEV